jgi:Flp pilus assembly protein CpaB
MGHRRRSKGPAFGSLGIIAGLALVLLIVLGLALMQGRPPPTRVSPAINSRATIDVLITAANIDEGAELKPALFRKESRPAKEYLSSHVVGSFEQLRGGYAKSFIAVGQPLLADHITAKAPVNSVVPKIRQGFRAISLKLDKQTTNEGWARAGVRVDVVLVSANSTRSSAMTIAQNLRVLSSGMSVSSEFGGESKLIQNGESTVTLEVSAEDQKRLKLAADRGELRLLLRGDEDIDVADERMKITVDGIISVASEKPKEVDPDQGWVIIDGRKFRVVGSVLLPG